MVLLALNLINKSDCLDEESLALILLFFLWFACVRPYEACLHNIGQLINILIELVFLSWSFGRKYIEILRSEDMEIYISMGIIALMTLSLAISIFRVFNAIRFNCTPPANARSRAAKPTEDMILNCERIEDVL